MASAGRVSYIGGSCHTGPLSDWPVETRHVHAPDVRWTPAEKALYTVST